jgi:glycosyltransferase involved in cell wall biosynthesis
MPSSAYVVVTAARNEERYIAGAIDSVVSQTVRPIRWVIVSDASTDRTDSIIESYAREYPFIRLLRLTKDHPRNFGAQVEAITAGVASLQSVAYDFIGNLDADVTFGPAYFEDLLRHFGECPKLGLAGGTVRELDGSIREACRGERLGSVPHAVQLFRRGCYEAVGGYPALPYGGPDTYAEVAARMKGWDVEAFEDLIVQHHRFVGSAGGLLRGRFRQGLMDFTLGYLPAFEFVKCARRVSERPALLGAAVRLSGFCWAYVGVRRRSVPDEFFRYLRAEQAQRMRAYFSFSESGRKQSPLAARKDDCGVR